jgi:hypothetical protein
MPAPDGPNDVHVPAPSSAGVGVVDDRGAQGRLLVGRGSPAVGLVRAGRGFSRRWTPRRDPTVEAVEVAGGDRHDCAAPVSRAGKSRAVLPQRAFWGRDAGSPGMVPRSRLEQCQADGQRAPAATAATPGSERCGCSGRSGCSGCSGYSRVGRYRVQASCMSSRLYPRAMRPLDRTSFGWMPYSLSILASPR